MEGPCYRTPSRITGFEGDGGDYAYILKTAMPTSSLAKVTALKTDEYIKRIANLVESIRPDQIVKSYDHITTKPHTLKSTAASATSDYLRIPL
jgi:hypothetical protein